MHLWKNVKSKKGCFVLMARCIDCAKASLKKMKCFPNSKDCRKSYDLTKEDLYKNARCDFFVRKRKDRRKR